MFEFNLESISQSIGLLGLALIALLIAGQKIFKEWRSTSVETNVIELMHAELERMSEQNSSLSAEVSKLHNEVIELSGQLRKLTLENQRLQQEVIALTNEISSLRQIAGKGAKWQDQD